MIKVIKKDLWELQKEGENICITTNGFVKKTGEAVMGRGCALEAARKFPKLPAVLGKSIKERGNIVHFLMEFKLICFPVKHNWWEKADIDLIKRSLRTIIELNTKIYLPLPGCGNGQLSWEDVKKELEPMLEGNDNIIFVDRP